MFLSKQEELFWDLYKCKTEQEVDKLIRQRPDIFHQSNWRPLGGNPHYFGVVESQQSNPVAALVEKLTNSIDAVLMRKCEEHGINPKSRSAPQTIDDAVQAFFPQRSNWDLRDPRSKQARSIQVLADGSRSNTSIVVYDDGIGQHPEDFEHTFLSLLRGNKRNIPFVQGKYNMGGTGAIVFCGKKRYQLIASKRYDGTGDFGFTLIRERPRHDEEYDEGSEYQYLLIDDEMPAFDIDELDLGLHRRRFHTGTVIKLYSYDVHGNRHFIRDMSPSLNQYLFEPALPYTIVESEQRYERSRDGYALSNYGLRRRLDNSDYLETSFPEAIRDRRYGIVKVTVYVFKPRAGNRSSAETKKRLRSLFFKNNRQVVFTVGGQVHGHYTAEFITRSLQMSLLRDYLLIHVDCTGMKPAFRKRLFKADRERMNQSEEASELRKKLAAMLKGGQLQEIFKQRKERLTFDSADDNDLLKQIGKDLPFQKELHDLLNQTLKLDQKGKQAKRPQPPKPAPEPEPFAGKRYPSFFNIDVKKRGDTPVIIIPQGSAKTVTFNSDVEDKYFDRSKDPGGLELGVMSYTPNNKKGGDKPGTVNDISDIFSIVVRSPKKGNIRVVLEPTEDVQVGDEVEMRADLLSSADPSGSMPIRFWVKIAEPQGKPLPKPKSEQKKDNLRLPKLTRVYQQLADDQPDAATWEKLDEAGISMDHGVIMHPDVTEAAELQTIFVNMDSKVLRKYRSGNLSEEKRGLIDRQNAMSVYYHTLFLYLINARRKYAISQQNGSDNYADIDLTDYLKDLFNSNYADFLLSFDNSALLDALE